MNIIRILSIIIILLILSPVNSFAQMFKIGAGGGITQILAPEGLTNEVSEEGLGYSTEWNVGGIVKIDLPAIPITPRGFLLYHSLSGSGNHDVLAKTLAEPDIENTQSILEIGAGIQFNFVPVPAGIDPYIALDLAYNNFGEFTSTHHEVETTSDGFSRFGAGIGFGTEVTIVPLINLDLYLSYKMFNLTGKEDNEDTMTAVSLDAFLMFNFL